MNAITTIHNLNFEACLWSAEDGLIKFRVGTCHGLYRAFPGQYLGILAVMNDCQGNGHFEDVMQWFEFAAQRDRVELRFEEIMNQQLLIHLCNKRGFTAFLMPNGSIGAVKYSKTIERPAEWSEIEAEKAFW